MANENSVLVVDDDASFLSLCAKTLEGRGYVVHQARNGEQGIALAREKRPDVVVLDMNLPDTTGLAVMHRLRADGVNSAVIGISGAFDVEVGYAILEMGAAELFTKDRSLVELIFSVRHAVEDVTLRNENKALKAKVNQLAARQLVTRAFLVGFVVILLVLLPLVGIPLDARMFLIAAVVLSLLIISPGEIAALFRRWLGDSKKGNGTHE